MSSSAGLFSSKDLELSHGLRAPVVAAALLGAPQLRLGEAARACVSAGADVLHIDVMDGRFAPQITFGSSLIQALKQEIGDAAPLDVHLLVDDVDRHVGTYLAAGADILTIPFETSDNPYKALEAIRGAGRRAGLAILPATPISAIDELLPLVDLVLVMTVHPGESRFLATSLQKVQRLREIAAIRKSAIRIGVDGGVKNETLPLMASAGADWIVAASAVFAGGNVKDNVSRLRDLAMVGRQ